MRRPRRLVPRPPPARLPQLARPRGRPGPPGRDRGARARASTLPRRPPARRAGRGRRGRLRARARRVALSSIHQAKGLEWPVVFVLQVEAGSFPSGWAVSEGNLDEEERLFYVAVTRAADELYLCRPIAARRAVGHRGGRRRAELRARASSTATSAAWSRSGPCAEGLPGWAGRDTRPTTPARAWPPRAAGSWPTRSPRPSWTSPRPCRRTPPPPRVRRRRRGRPRRPPARPAREDARSPPGPRGPWPTRPGPSPPPSCRPSSSASTSTRCWRRLT